MEDGETALYKKGVEDNSKEGKTKQSIFDI